jgi:hypothetical protein
MPLKSSCCEVVLLGKKYQRISDPAVGPGLHSKISVILTIMSDRAGVPGFFSLIIAFISSYSLPRVLIAATPFI